MGGRRYFQKDKDNHINNSPEVIETREKVFKIVYIILWIFFIVSSIVFVYMIYLGLSQSLKI